MVHVSGSHSNPLQPFTFKKVSRSFLDCANDVSSTEATRDSGTYGTSLIFCLLRINCRSMSGRIQRFCVDLGSRNLIEVKFENHAQVFCREKPLQEGHL